MIGVHKMHINIICEALEGHVRSIFVRVFMTPPRQCLASEQVGCEFYFVLLIGVFVQRIKVLIDFKYPINNFCAVENRRLYPFGQSLPKPCRPPYSSKSVCRLSGHIALLI
jgi:hypothetical protein